MTRILPAALALVLAAPGLAVEVQSIILDTVSDVLIIVKPNGNSKSYPYGDKLPLDQTDLDDAKAELQDFFDTVLRRNQDLPSGDPDRDVDPGHECAHWTGPGPRIVYRSTVVVEITTDANGDPVPHLRNCDPTRPPL